MLVKLRSIFQLLFLAIFVAVVAAGRVQVWMIILVASIFLSLLLGRFFCGFICPINTLLEGVHWLKARFKIKDLAVPRAFKSPYWRVGFVVVLLAIIATTVVTGKQIPVFPIVSVLALALSLIFVPALWHRYLCPFGALLNLSGKYSFFHLAVNSDSCNMCKKCIKVCPAEAITMEADNNYPQLHRGLCLTCFACVKSCHRNCIAYGSHRVSKDAVEN